MSASTVYSFGLASGDAVGVTMAKACLDSPTSPSKPARIDLADTDWAATFRLRAEAERRDPGYWWLKVAEKPKPASLLPTEPLADSAQKLVKTLVQAPFKVVVSSQTLSFPAHTSRRCLSRQEWEAEFRRKAEEGRRAQEAWWTEVQNTRTALMQARRDKFGLKASISAAVAKVDDLPDKLGLKPVISTDELAVAKIDDKVDDLLDTLGLKPAINAAELDVAKVDKLPAPTFRNTGKKSKVVRLFRKIIRIFTA